MPDTDLKVRKRIYRVELGAYLLIIAVTAVGFWKMEQNQDALEETQKQQQIDRCVSGQEVRQAQRANIQAVYSLAVTLVEPSPGEQQPNTPEAQAEIDQYLETAKQFRDNALAKVPATPPGCEDFVEGEAND